MTLKSTLCQLACESCSLRGFQAGDFHFHRQTARHLGDHQWGRNTLCCCPSVNYILSYIAMFQNGLCIHLQQTNHSQIRDLSLSKDATTNYNAFPCLHKSWESRGAKSRGNCGLTTSSPLNSFTLKLFWPIGLVKIRGRGELLIWFVAFWVRVTLDKLCSCTLPVQRRKNNWGAIVRPPDLYLVPKLMILQYNHNCSRIIFMVHKLGWTKHSNEFQIMYCAAILYRYSWD